LMVIYDLKNKSFAMTLRLRTAGKNFPPAFFRV
jgi:hypothetical protein